MRIVLIFGFLSFIGCKSKPTPAVESTPYQLQERKIYTIDGVFSDNMFSGGRLNDFSQINDSLFRAFIAPENQPVNSSPWYAFRLWSDQERKIKLEITYEEGFKHRYVPKISQDGEVWKPLSADQFATDSSSKIVSFDLTLSSVKTWVSAQEIMHSEIINAWCDSLAYENFITKKSIGKSKMEMPINLLSVKKGEPENAILLIGRQHPPEVPGGTISMMAFVETLLDDSDLANRFLDNFEILLFPLLNPDGVDEGNWRHNANGKDLNRDWIEFNEPETQAVRDWIYNEYPKKDKIRFGIDFHTSYNGPYLLVLDTLPHRIKPEITNQWINLIEKETGDTLDIRPRAQTLPYCYNWVINDLNAEAVTYEEGDEIDRATVRERAKNYARSLMTILLK